MLNWLFKGKDLKEHLNQTKTIIISGVIFKIKKLNPYDYLDGSNSIAQTVDTYKIKENQETNNTSIKKIKAHFIDVLMAGVVYPKLSREKDGDGIFVENLFTDIDMANKLYEEINKFTYGKKKLQ